MPAHFAERHGLIVIIALGESIVAIGVGSNAVVDAGVVAAAALGSAIAAALWWLYFGSVIAWPPSAGSRKRRLGASRTSSRVTPFLLHFPMVGDRARRTRPEEDARARGRPARERPGRRAGPAARPASSATSGSAGASSGQLSTQRLTGALATGALFPLARELPPSGRSP